MLKDPIYVFTHGAMYINIPTNNVNKFIDSHTGLQNNKTLQNGYLNRKKRDGDDYHLTIIEPQEMKTLTKNGEHIQSEKIKDLIDLFMIGIGFAAHGTSSCIYIVCVSEQLSQFRFDLGLNHKDLHITLGFIDADIYSVDKSLKTIISHDPIIIINHINGMMDKIKTHTNYYPVIKWFLQKDEEGQLCEELKESTSLKLIDSLNFDHSLHQSAINYLVEKEKNYLSALYYESKYLSKTNKLSHYDIHNIFSDKIRECNPIIRDVDADIIKKTLNVLNYPLSNNIKWLYELGYEKSRTYFWYEYSITSKLLKWFESPRNFSFVTENLSGSSIPDKEEDIDFFNCVGISQIITLMETPLNDIIQKKIKSHKIKYSFFPIDDRTPPSFDQMREITKLIAQCKDKHNINNRGKIVIHCKGGVGRTATILIAYLVTLGKTRTESTMLLQKRRTILSNKQEEFLKEWTSQTFVMDSHQVNIHKDISSVKQKSKIKLPQLIILVGLPASGKTTFAQTIDDQIANVQRINQDEIRTKGKCDELFSKYTKNINQTVILDRCNLTINERRYWLDLNNTNEKNVWCIHFASNPEECKWRIKNRKDHPTVTDSLQGQRLIENISNTLQVPTIEEGFSQIDVIESFKDANFLLLKIGCSINHLVEINHDHIIKFPRTKHLHNLGSVQRDDLMAPSSKIEIFLKSFLYIEEKIDGANLGISIKDFKLTAQNRSHYVNSSYHSQFKPLDKWLIDHSQDLWEILQDETKILYGEWVYAKHSIHYTDLPDYFIAFDLWDMVEKRFYSRQRLENILANTSIKYIPLVCSGSFASMNEILKFVTTKSQFYNGPIEGVYIRICDNMWLTDRAKIVRNDFLSGNEHWTKNIMTINKVV